MTERLAISTPAEVLHAVPFLVGFHPASSVVVISLHEDEGDSRRVGLTIRLDYPGDEGGFATIADRLIDHLIDDGAEGALIVIYRDRVPAGERDPMFAALREALADQELRLHDALIVSDQRWWSLMAPTPSVQAVPDFASSVVTAEHVLHGASLPHASEDALRATLEPAGSPMSEQIAHACAARRDVVNRETILEGDSSRMRAVRRHHIQLGADAVDRVFRAWIGSRELADPQDLAVMMIGMHDVHVRDYAMGIHGDDQLQSALDLWRTLLPLTPSGSIAPVATVLAAVAFECGDGALAQRAIDRAFDDRQGYPMASLLRQAMEAGWAPAAMTSMRKDLRAAVVATVRAA